MPRQQWSAKRERQYEHVKSSAKDRGESEDRAEEIAARTVNKNRARSGESKQASKTSTHDMSPQQRGGKRSGRPGPRGQTRDQLYAEAKRRGVKGRSNMSKKELQDALNK
ncbi:plasmid stabilization protein [Actinoallomurus acaciae]|uniref:Plasmid stabilization protein n=1 Tax=Actinoallomurus acaciae TaxID=502577 RepID=A0ABV5Y7R2_9ACTN